MKEKVSPLCGSLKCVGRITSNAKNYVLKNVPFSSTVCPDCKSMLFWKPDHRNRKVSRCERKLAESKRDFL